MSYGNRRLFTALLSATMLTSLAGCKQAEPIEELAVETPPVETPVIEEETVKSVVWAKEPTTDWVEYFVEMSGLNYYNDQNLITMYSGYGPEMIQVNDIEYTGDAIAAGKDGKMAIYDYDGNMLFDDGVNAGVNVPLMGYYTNPFVLYDTGWTYISADGTRPIISADFTRTLNDDEIPEAVEVANSADLSTVGSIAAVVDGKAGLVSRNGVFTETIEISNGGTYALACKYNLANRSCDGVAVIDPSGEYLYDVPYTLSGSDSFVNNYVKVTDDESNLQNLDFVHYRLIDTGLGEKYGLFDATAGKMLTDVKYDNIKYFEEGYCPVEMDGKWGYINEEGEEVTDFVFDAASALYDGKAYVTVGGKVGIIDLKATLDNEIPVTEETVYLDVDKVESELHTPEGGIGYAVIREAGAYKFYNKPTALVSEATVTRTENVDAGDASIMNIISFADIEGRIWYEVRKFGSEETSWIPETEDRVLISNLTVDVIRSQDPKEEPEEVVETPKPTVTTESAPTATPEVASVQQTQSAQEPVVYEETTTWNEVVETEESWSEPEQTWSEPAYEEPAYVAPTSGIDAIRAQYNGNYSGLSCEEVAGLYTGWGGNGLSWTGYIVDNPQPGDIIMYYDSSWSYRHTAVFLGDGLALHGSYNRGDKSAQVASMYIGGYVHMLYFRLGEGALYPCTVLQTGRNNGGNGGWMDKFQDYYGACAY